MIIALSNHISPDRLMFAESSSKH